MEFEPNPNRVEPGYVAREVVGVKGKDFDRIQDRDGKWGSIESYLEKTTDTDITHGLRPDCETRMTSGLADNGRTNGGAA
jgi:hypothetical protein